MRCSSAYCDTIEYDVPGDTLSRALVQKHRLSLTDSLNRYCFSQSMRPLRLTLRGTLVQSVSADRIYAVMLFDCAMTRRIREIRQNVAAVCSVGTRNGFDELDVCCVHPASFSLHDGFSEETFLPSADTSPDQTADFILKTYLPEALQSAQAVDSRKLAVRLGLKIDCCCFDLSISHTGKVFMDDGTVTEYGKNGETKKRAVKRRTILINRIPGQPVDPKTESNTIMHEILHWILHLQYFELQKALHPERCLSVMEDIDREIPDVFSRMERQIREISPRVLLPEPSVRAYADAFLNSRPQENREKLLDELTKHLSDTFQVSPVLAGIRLQELGYRKTSGFVRGVTYKIPREMLLRLLETDPALRSRLNTGHWIYLEDRLCLRAPSFIHADSAGKLRLTEQAKRHPESCCLPFYRTCVSVPDASGMYRTRRESLRYCGESHGVPTLRKRNLDRYAAGIRSLPSGFWETLDCHRKAKNMTALDFAQRCCVAGRTLERYRNAWPEKRFDIETVIVFCIVLKLNPVFSQDLIRKSGTSLMLSSCRDTMYQYLLWCAPFDSLEDCNEVLQAQGYDPLRVHT